MCFSFALLSLSFTLWRLINQHYYAILLLFLSLKIRLGTPFFRIIKPLFCVDSRYYTYLSSYYVFWNSFLHLKCKLFKDFLPPRWIFTWTEWRLNLWQRNKAEPPPPSLSLWRSASDNKNWLNRELRACVKINSTIFIARSAIKLYEMVLQLCISKYENHKFPLSKDTINPVSYHRNTRHWTFAEYLFSCNEF